MYVSLISFDWIGVTDHGTKGIINTHSFVRSFVCSFVHLFIHLAVNCYPWSTLNSHSSDTLINISVCTWSTVDQHYFGRESDDSQLILADSSQSVGWHILLSWNSASYKDCQSSVDWVWIIMLIEGQFIVGCGYFIWSRVNWSTLNNGCLYSAHDPVAQADQL